MGMTTHPIGHEEAGDDDRDFDDLEKATILSELEAILKSPIFQTSKRGQQFLSYVVHHRLEGNHERLKERTIGVDLFQRPVGYATGDDPVVRVQAGEVRRRLNQYYQATPDGSSVRIELHVGSYTPEFKWTDPEKRQVQVSGLQPVPAPQEIPREAGLAGGSTPIMFRLWSRTRPILGRYKLHLLAVALVVLVGLALIESIHHRSASESVIQKFWSPAINSSEPVLICLAKPPVYRPSVGLYQRHSKDPEKFLDQFERLTQKPDLKPDEKLTWGDMVEYPDYGLATGDVYSAISLIGFFSQLGKKNLVRIGGDYSFEDLRNSPSVVIGAFNNRWAMQMTSSLHFAFADEGDQSIIEEEGTPNRRWYSRDDSNGKALDDYAVVTRLLNSKTGQFVVVVAGIRSYGTQAAGEFVSNPVHLQEAFRTAAPDWEKRNVQILLHIQVTDGLPGPPQVVAMYVW